MECQGLMLATSLFCKLCKYIKDWFKPIFPPLYNLTWWRLLIAMFDLPSPRHYYPVMPMVRTSSNVNWYDLCCGKAGCNFWLEFLAFRYCYSGLDVCDIGYAALVFDNSTCLSTSCLFVYFQNALHLRDAGQRIYSNNMSCVIFFKKQKKKNKMSAWLQDLFLLMRSHIEVSAIQNILTKLDDEVQV